MRWDYVILIAIYVITRSAFFIIFGNASWEHDSYEHYYQSKIFSETWNLETLFNTWNKAIFTFISSLLILIHDDIAIVKIFNVLVWLTIILIVYGFLVKKTGSRLLAYLGALICIFDFIGFRASVAALTEASAALLILIGVVYSRRYFGVITLLRPELVILTVPYFLERPNRKLIIDVVICSIPSFVAITISYIFIGDYWYPFRSHYPEITGGTYGVGGLMYFLALFVKISPVVIVSIFLGLIVGKKERQLLLMLTSIVLFVCFHVYLYAYDRMGSAGLPRYFTSIIPVASILLCLAINNIGDRFVAKLKAVTCSLVIFSMGITFLRLNGGGWEFNSTNAPPEETNERRFSRIAGGYLKAFGDSAIVNVSNPAIRYFLDQQGVDSRWPQSDVLLENGQYIVVEPNLYGYSGIKTDIARKSGEVIFNIDNLELIAIGKKQDFKGEIYHELEGSRIVWRNRNLVEYSNIENGLVRYGNLMQIEDNGQLGVLHFGPYLKLWEGQFSIVFECSTWLKESDLSLKFDVYSNKVLVEETVSFSDLFNTRDGTIKLDFDAVDGQHYEFRIEIMQGSRIGLRVENIFLIEK